MVNNCLLLDLVLATVLLLPDCDLGQITKLLQLIFQDLRMSFSSFFHTNEELGWIISKVIFRSKVLSSLMEDKGIMI